MMNNKMMKHYFLDFCPLYFGLPLTLLAALSDAQIVPVPFPTALRQAIQADYDQMDVAFDRKDLDGSLAFDTPTYLRITAQGDRQTLAQVRAANAILLGQAGPDKLGKTRAVSSKTTIQSLEMTPNGATVLARQHLEITGQVHDFFFHMRIKLVTDNTWRDLWVKTAQGWRVVQSQNLFHQTTINGKREDRM